MFYFLSSTFRLEFTLESKGKTIFSNPLSGEVNENNEKLRKCFPRKVFALSKMSEKTEGTIKQKVLKVYRKFSSTSA